MDQLDTTEDFLRSQSVLEPLQNSELSKGQSSENERYATERIPRTRENDPTALDIIQALIDPDEEEKQSEYMKGHVSQEKIHETFLMDASQKFPESTLRINCVEHNAPATFYSRVEQKYQCLKCLVARENLQYIDKKYKKQLEEFESIKGFAAKVINENAPNIHIIADWKASIRDTLIAVKEKYIEWVETFTKKFVKSLNKIEHSEPLSDYVGEDKRQELRLIDMQNKYRDILRIFHRVQMTPPDDKLAAIEGFRPEMSVLHQYLSQKDKEMKRMTSKVHKAMRETVDLDGLSSKIVGKYLKFIQTRAHQPIDIVINRKVQRSQMQTPAPENQNDQAADLGSMQPQDIQSPPRQQRQGAQQAEMAQDQAQGPQNQGPDLNTSVMTVSSRYRHENQNSIYSLQPNSSDIYLLDFKQRGFCKEALTFKRGASLIPSGFTSLQTSDANIYVVGGYKETQAGGVKEPLDTCLQIDANLSVYPRDKLKLARFNTCLALIRNRFVIAMGGRTGNNTQTKLCEAFDSHTNAWFNLAAMPRSVADTSAIVMNNRYIYVMPGPNEENKRGQSIYISMLDSGPSSNFNGDKTSKMYGASMANQKWTSLLITNPTFVAQMPTAAAQINTNEMIIFGGKQNSTFKFDTREVNPQTQTATVSIARGSLQARANFAKECDFLARSFKSTLYTIDASEKMLHVLQIQEQTWLAQPLSQLGIPK